MWQTLFHIPRNVGDTPFLGVGLLLLAWGIFCAALLVWLVYKQGWNSDTLGYLPVFLLVGAGIAFLLPAVSDDIGLPIRGYGVMLLLAVVSGVGLSARRAQRRGIHPDLIFSLALWMAAAGLICARAFYVIEYWDERIHKESNWDTFLAVVNIPQGGLVVFGAFVGGVAAAVLFCRRHKIPILKMGDIAAPGMILGLAIGRVGCFLSGCCYGGQCDLPWAVTFPFGSAAFQRQVELQQLPVYGLKLQRDQSAPAIIASVEPGSPAATAGLKAGQKITRVIVQWPGAPRNQTLDLPIKSTGRALEAFWDGLDMAGTSFSVVVADDPLPKTWKVSAQAARSLPVHPTQLYSAIDAFLLFLFLLAYEPFQRRDGVLVAWMMTLHAISRFFLETIRVDEPAVLGTGLSVSQNISIIFLILGLGLWAYLLFGPARPRQAAAMPAA